MQISKKDLVTTGKYIHRLETRIKHLNSDVIQLRKFIYKIIAESRSITKKQM